jgi:hypothetical protein
VSPTCLFALTDAVGTGAEAGLGRVDSCQINRGVGAGFVETGLVLADKRCAVLWVRSQRAGRWLRRRMLERR